MEFKITYKCNAQNVADGYTAEQLSNALTWTVDARNEREALAKISRTYGAPKSFSTCLCDYTTDVVVEVM